VSLASRSLRNVTGRNERIEDQAELAQVRRQALKVNLKSLLTAVILTLLVLALPRP
jgi:hypothetical protein